MNNRNGIGGKWWTSKTFMAIGVALVTLIGVVLIGLVSVVTVLNTETDLATRITAKQRDNQNEMDGMWKTISQAAQVTEAQKNALLDIFKGYAGARSSGAAGGSLATWIKESVPNVDVSTYNNLMNVIVSKRDGFVRRQKELLDLSREHNRTLRSIPSGWICSIFGRKEIPVTIVTSDRTERAFESGKDNNVDLFPK